MAQKKSYSRYFIILQEDEKGYAMAADKLPSGYAKLEMKNDKGKAAFYVQNLKREMGPYYPILICSKKDVNKVVKLKELNIDDQGRAEVSYDYNVENMDDTGISMDKISGAAIVRFVDESSIPIMCGFSSTDIPQWRSFDVIGVEAKKVRASEEEVKPEDVKQEVEIVKELVSKDNRHEVRDNDKEERRHSEKKAEKEVKENKKSEVRQEEPTVEAKNENGRKVNTAEKVDEFDKYEEKIEALKKAEDRKKHEDRKHEDRKHADSKHEDKKVRDSDYESSENGNMNYFDMSVQHGNNKSSSGEMGSKSQNFFTQVADGLEEIQDMNDEIKNCKWYKVPVQHLESMYNMQDMNKYTVVYYPMMNYYPYIKRYGHYVVGYKYHPDGKVKYLVYGIPGTKNKFHQPYGGRSGFVSWMPLKAGEEEDDDYGYWLMFYDFRTANILIPMK